MSFKLGGKISEMPSKPNTSKPQNSGQIYTGDAGRNCPKPSTSTQKSGFFEKAANNPLFVIIIVIGIVALIILIVWGVYYSITQKQLLGTFIPQEENKYYNYTYIKNE